ncbi:NXPE family member 3 [Camelus dromedarius]|uniref:NXPE family member 3 n=1 Tax=Camelus dromedarius TaxID=9838 RepID=A0A5N4CW15_CAMDR|nr:NXPE family member 3 [Camelus dromedarius]
MGGDLLASTSPKTSTCHLRDPAQASYTLGGYLEAVLITRDHQGRPKTHGGDLFRAQLLGPDLKAGVPGDVKDLENGTYLLSLPLLWAGQAQGQVQLIHSSEAVRVLRGIWRDQWATVDFMGYFQGPTGYEEIVTCNVNPLLIREEGSACHYRDEDSEHSSGRYWNVTTPHEEALLARNVTDQALPQGTSPIWVAEESSRSLGPKPSGFYHQNMWHSLSCSSRSFSTADSVLGCLAGHIVHMMGDSTLQQWWEYLCDTVPSLKPVGLHATCQTGPLMAMDTTQGIVLHWRAHRWPLHSLRTPVASLHSVARELEGLAGATGWDPGRRGRAPGRETRTLVVIKLAKTSYKFVYGSDWFILQVNRLLQAAFADLRVAFVDAWEMTSSLALLDSIHPRRHVIQNELDFLLSYVCPT